MQVQKIQNNNSDVNFRGRFLKNSSLKQLEQKLSGTEKDTFEKFVKDIEGGKDDSIWGFSIDKIFGGKLAVIRRLDNNGQPRPDNQIIFIDGYKTDSDSLSVFKKLHDWVSK